MWFIALICLFLKVSFSYYSLMKIIRVSNGLDLDQDRHYVGLDLGPNCLQRSSENDTSKQRVKQSCCYNTKLSTQRQSWSGSKLFAKLSEDDTSRQRVRHLCSYNTKLSTDSRSWSGSKLFAKLSENDTSRQRVKQSCCYNTKFSTDSRSWSGFKLFAKIIRRWH